LKPQKILARFHPHQYLHANGTAPGVTALESEKPDEELKITLKRSHGEMSPPSDVASQSDLSTGDSPMVYVDIDGDESEQGFSEVSSSISPDEEENKKIKVENDDDNY